MAVALHLIPRTMKAKLFLKRAFFGRLVSLPPGIYEGTAKYSASVAISFDSPNYEYRLLYTVDYK